MEASNNLDDISKFFSCLPEPPDIADEWRRVVEKHDVLGKQAHDARLVALMLAHDVIHLVTLNPGDFARYTEITSITPQEIVAQEL